MSGNGNQVPLAPNQRGPGPYPRTSTPHRPLECYHPSGAAGGAYMPSTSGGAQTSTQPTLRVQPTAQPSAPPAPQQDMSKTNMTGHNYVPQNQSQPRPQFPNYQYRPTQHGSRPNTHPRQQQPYLPGSAATTGPVMAYGPLVFQPAPMGMQSYQQSRSSTQGFYQYMGHSYFSYNTPPNHTSPYYGYTSNSPQLPTPSMPSSTPGGRTNPTTMVGPQGTPATPTAPSVSLPHQQAPTLMHQTMPGIRTAVKKNSKRIPILDPVTRQEVLSDLYTNDSSSFISGDVVNDRQTPQPEPTHSVAEQFNRMVNEVANQPCESGIKSNYGPKSIDTALPTGNLVQPQTNTIGSINNIVKSEILNVNEKSLGLDVAVEPNETPVVSAISDSPVIVPKMNIKQLQKPSDQNVQSVALDTNKNIPINKQHKVKNVPQVEDVEKPSDNVNVVPVNLPASVAPANPPIAPAIPPASPAIPTATPAISPVALANPPVAPAIAPVAPAHSPPPALTAAIPPPAPAAAVPSPVPTLAPQPRRIREPRERGKPDEKDKVVKESSHEKETPPIFKPNGPVPPTSISSVDSLSVVINHPTSQANPPQIVDTTRKSVKQLPPTTESVVPILPADKRRESASKIEPSFFANTLPTATELLSASIEKFARDSTVPEAIPENKEASSAIDAQTKLTQSISSVLRNNQPELKMKDNFKTSDPDTANGNSTDVTKTETVQEDINKNEKAVKNSKNNNKKLASKMVNNDVNVKELETQENGQDEENVENVTKPEEADKPATPNTPSVFVPKYKYGDDQWSPLNTAGKKCYDIGLLKQIKEDPLSKNKPNVPLLESLNVIRSTPLQEPLFNIIQRPATESLIFPHFANKGSGLIGSRSNAPNPKKDGRNMAQSNKGSAKLATPSGNSLHKPTIYMSLSLREDVKLNEVDSAWKPTRFRKDNTGQEDFKTQELYKKFRGILNKLTPQKFDTLMDKIKTLEINNQKRLEGVIDLVFEKAIDEPNFSEAYAGMCNKLSVLKVPADNATNPDQCVNFRALIITRCQQQFETDKVDEIILKLEKEMSECTDPVKKKEFQLMLEEENRKVRMRSVGNVRFIGELYKLKMLTCKIMEYCMKHLIDKLEEEKLECLCKLLTTIGEQIENEPNSQLNHIFKIMQDIVDRKSNKISSRVKFMIQDVIELRRRKWVAKSVVVDSQPKMMDQIQKEAEQQQRQIELMNASSMGYGRRDEGGRGKRGGDSRRQNSNNPYSDNNWKTPRSNFPQPVDTSKLKAVTQKNLNNIKLAPPAWNHGAKNTAQIAANPPIINLSKNMYSMLENAHTDPSSLRTTRDMTPSYHSKGASIERSTFNSRADFASGGSSRSGSMGVARSNSGTRSSAPPTPPAAPEPPAPEQALVPQEPLPEPKRKSVKSMIDLYLINSADGDEMVADVKHLFQPQYHAAVISEILNVALEKSAKEVELISKSLLHLITTKTISSDNFVAGIKEVFEFAPDLYIDIPMLYDYLGKMIALQIEKKHVTFNQIFENSEAIIAANHGHLFLKSLIKELNDSMGPTFVKSKWQESGMKLSKWMSEDQVAKLIEDNILEFLEGGVKSSEESKQILNPAQTQNRLLQLMNTEESCDCIKGWVQDKFGKASNEAWFMRALIQAICEHALFGPESRDVPHFSQERMNKYARLIQEFGEDKEAREANCLFGIQQLIHRLEHPQGLTLEIFQYLHEQYIIPLESFLAWEESEKEPEGKGVMLKALTSFFTNIKEADNEDSCSED